AALFGFLLPLQLLNLLTLLFQLLLLLLDLRLGLSVGVLVVLHRVADCEAAYAADGRADGGACQGRADCRTDDRAGGRADTRTAQGAFFTGGHRCTRTSGDKEKPGQGQRTQHDVFAHCPSPQLFGFALTLQLLNLLLLALDLLLLTLNLRLSLSVGGFLILHLVADRVSAQCADTAADCRARQRVANCSADDRTGRGSDTRSDKRALLTCREGLPRASHDCHDRNRHEQTFDYRYRVCPHELPPYIFSSFHACRSLRLFSQPAAGEFIQTPLVFYLLCGQSTISNIGCSIEIFTDFLLWHIAVNE